VVPVVYTILDSWSHSGPVRWLGRRLTGTSKAHDPDEDPTVPHTVGAVPGELVDREI
jgi:hypothetical protein